MSGLSGRILSSDGWPVPDAVLTVTNLAGEQIERVTADADGLVGTGPLDPDTYTAIITAPGYAPVAQMALVPGSGSAPLGTVELSRVGDSNLPEPGRWSIDPIHTSIVVTARHFGLASIRGRFNEFSGEIQIATPIERSTVSAEIKSASIDTGNSMRDNHLRSADFLDVEQFPTIAYRSTGLRALDSERWQVEGELTLNGVTKPVPLQLSYLGTGPDQWGGTRAAFHASTDLRRDDFSINYSEVVRAGIAAVGTTLRVEIDVEAVLGDLPKF
jgi:polyisoprenoid-binding protein YceI